MLRTLYFGILSFFFKYLIYIFRTRCTFTMDIIEEYSSSDEVDTEIPTPVISKPGQTVISQTGQSSIH